MCVCVRIRIEYGNASFELTADNKHTEKKCVCEREGVRENNKRANFKKSKKNNTAISYGDYGQRRKKKIKK